MYDELRKLASAKLVQEKPGQALQATELLHEAYDKADEHQSRIDEYAIELLKFFASGCSSGEVDLNPCPPL